ncbi:MAG TPA: hypothetical protein VIM96_04800 [Pseudomonadales bacterium]
MAKQSSKNASLTREELGSHIAQFLKGGGKIDRIPSGVSGIQPGKGPKHIRITPSRR